VENSPSIQQSGTNTPALKRIRALSRRPEREPLHCRLRELPRAHGDRRYRYRDDRRRVWQLRDVSGSLNVLVCQRGLSGDGRPATDATLNYPESVALDPSGNLVIANTINHRIRWVDALSGLIYTNAGNGQNGFSRDEGPALAAEISFPVSVAVDRSGRVYFANEHNNRIRLLTPLTSQFRLFRKRPRR
jgi:DNA-binding beta-propeller fold protein YncE